MGDLDRRLGPAGCSVGAPNRNHAVGPLEVAGGGSRVRWLSECQGTARGQQGWFRHDPRPCGPRVDGCPHNVVAIRPPPTGNRRRRTSAGQLNEADLVRKLSKAKGTGRYAHPNGGSDDMTIIK